MESEWTILSLQNQKNGILLGASLLTFMGLAHKSEIADPGFPGRRFYLIVGDYAAAAAPQTVSKMSWVTTYGSQLALGRRSSI